MGIEALSWDHDTKLGVEAEVQDRMKGVSEIENQKGAGDARNTAEVGHCSIGDESQFTVDRSESPPHVSAPLLLVLGNLKTSWKTSM
jgi:hypothetical protein